jgi:hypothetical protein
MAVRPEVANKNPGMKPTEVMKICSQRWTELDQAQKENFSAQFKKELEEYNKVMEKFTKSLTPEQKNAMEQVKADKVMRRDKLQKKQRLEELGKPKRPKSSFMNFLASQADILKKKGSPEEVRERIKSLSTKWNSLSAEEKAPFFEAYRKDMEVYARALAKWEEKMIRMGNDDLVRLNKKKLKVEYTGRFLISQV